MSIRTSDANYLANTAARVNASIFPFTCGAWVSSTSLADDSYFFSVVASASSDANRISFGSAGNQWNINMDGGGVGEDFTNSAGSFVVNTWYYVVGRYSSATNRRMIALHPNGAAQEVVQTASRTPVNCNSVYTHCTPAFGFTHGWPGHIAELWWANVDIQPDGASLNTAMLRQLAYEGPFSVPHVAPNIVEYSSFRENRILRDYATYAGRWAHAGTVQIAPHPPLLARYRYPDDAQSLAVI